MNTLDPDIDAAGPPRVVPNDDALGAAVKRFLLQRAVERIGSRSDVRRRLHAADTVTREAARALAAKALAEGVSSVEAGRLQRVERHPATEPSEWRLWLRRVAQLALEELLGEAVTPEVRVGLAPLEEAERRAALPGGWTHAIVCGELLGFVNEIYPLVLDAYAHDLATAGAVRLDIVGVHHDWLDPRGRARRIVFYDHAGEALRERALAQPLALDSAHLLCLGRGEQALHGEIAERLRGCLLLNPPGASRRADRKSDCFRLWAAAGIPTPETLLVPAEATRHAVASALAGLFRGARWRGLVVQPDQGTEGEGVAAFECADDATHAAALDHVRALQAGGDVVLRERVPGLRYRVGGVDFSADLRVNVAWDGQRYVAESGYLQVASDASAFASSVGRGGRIVKLSEGARETMGLGPDDVTCIRDVAASAAEALACGLGERLMLVGIDLKLERATGGVRPWVLDANPRPAGLSYSELFATREPGVTTGLWRAVFAHCPPQRDERRMSNGAARSLA